MRSDRRLARLDTKAPRYGTSDTQPKSLSGMVYRKKYQVKYHLRPLANIKKHLLSFRARTMNPYIYKGKLCGYHLNVSRSYLGHV